MKRAIDVDAILAPLPGDNPVGEDLRYTPTYSDLQEARRADDLLDQGDWKREIKRSDWNQVIALAAEALTKKTKDLQIAVWLTEALVRTEGFEGFAVGLGIVNGLLQNFWESVYPQVEDGDFEFRIGPVEFLNDKVASWVKDAPITDPGATRGYSWLLWNESRKVGYEKDILDRFGDVDLNKKRLREELIEEGKLTGEEFDAAVNSSSRAHFESLADAMYRCLGEFNAMDALMDEKLGRDAPRLAEFKASLEDCSLLIRKLLEEKRKSDPAPDPMPETVGDQAEQPVPSPQPASEMQASEAAETSGVAPAAEMPAPSLPASPAAPAVPTSPSVALPDWASYEKTIWEQALHTLQASGFKPALGQLLGVCCSAPSVREKNRYRLLISKLCLKAKRPDLARPIVEELYALIEELHLDRWESPLWVAEVVDALYQCLTAGEAPDSDIERAGDLFRKLCSMDVTKAMSYKN